MLNYHYSGSIYIAIIPYTSVVASLVSVSVHLYPHLCTLLCFSFQQNVCSIIIKYNAPQGHHLSTVNYNNLCCDISLGIIVLQLRFGTAIDYSHSDIWQMQLARPHLGGYPQIWVDIQTIQRNLSKIWPNLAYH
jgi:hypothetical protein